MNSLQSLGLLQLDASISTVTSCFAFHFHSPGGSTVCKSYVLPFVSTVGLRALRVATRN